MSQFRNRKRRRKVPCEVEDAQVEFNDRLIDGVSVTCTDCGHEETAGGTSEASVKRCLAQMGENCPEGERNFYVDAEEFEDE